MFSLSPSRTHAPSSLGPAASDTGGSLPALHIADRESSFVLAYDLEETGAAFLLRYPVSRIPDRRAVSLSSHLSLSFLFLLPFAGRSRTAGAALPTALRSCTAAVARPSLQVDLRVCTRPTDLIVISLPESWSCETTARKRAVVWFLSSLPCLPQFCSMLRWPSPRLLAPCTAQCQDRLLATTPFCSPSRS
jgi:hypothetical protein